MPDRVEDRQAVEQEILDAFSHQTYPGDASIVGGDFGEYLDAKRELRGFRWQDLSDDHIARTHWVLPFLSPTGFCFYCPAYLLYSLRHIHAPDLVTDAVFSHLTVNEQFWPRVRLLDLAQQRAIRHFLEFMKQHCQVENAEEVTEALDGYWRRIK